MSKQDQIAFVCVAFGDQRYIEQQARLKHSILQIYPDAPLFFWTDELPPGSRSFNESMYGFKPYAVYTALHAGYKRIAFFDPAVILIKPLDFYQNIINQYGVIAIQDDNKLSPFCYDKALNYYGLSRDQIKDWHLVGGSFYYFDFELQSCRDITYKWLRSEESNLFGSQKEQASEQLKGHRNDEAMMSLALYTSGSKPLTDDTRYNCENEQVAIMIKKHFK